MLCLPQGIKKWSKQVKFHTNVISDEEAIQDKTHFHEPYKIDLKKKKQRFLPFWGWQFCEFIHCISEKFNLGEIQ